MELTTQQTEEGFFFANDGEKEEGILTWINPKGKALKQVSLPDSRKVLQMRKPGKADYLEALLLTKSRHKGSKLTGERLISLSAVCSTCNGKKLTLAEVNNLSIKDFTKVAFTLNCLITQ